MPEPGPDARGRGSSSGCGVWTASAPGSPPCSPCDRPASSSTADVARYAGRGGTVARSSDTCVVFAWSSAGILQPPMMRTSTPHRDVGRRRAEEDEETFTGSLSKKTPPKNTAVSHRWNHYTFRSVLAAVNTHPAIPLCISMVTDADAVPSMRASGGAHRQMRARFVPPSATVDQNGSAWRGAPARRCGPSGSPQQDSELPVSTASLPALLVQPSRSSSDIAPDRTPHALPILPVVRQSPPRPHGCPVGRVALPFEPHEVLPPNTLVHGLGGTRSACNADELLLRRRGRGAVRSSSCPWAGRCARCRRILPNGAAGFPSSEFCAVPASCAAESLAI